MKATTLLTALLLCTQVNLRAQTDTPATLEWVSTQAGRLDTLLLNAVRSYNQGEMVQTLLDAYLIFDAVALAGVYCAEVRDAAQEGRRQCDVLNYRLSKEMNSNVLRATQARVQAEKMRQAAQNCQAQPNTSDKGFSPADVIRADAEIAELDLTDGLAAGNFHIFSQKAEHAVRTLRDLQHLALTLDQCREPYQLAQQAIQHCEAALAARNWTEINSSTAKALVAIRQVSSATCQ